MECGRGQRREIEANNAGKGAAEAGAGGAGASRCVVRVLVLYTRLGGSSEWWEVKPVPFLPSLSSSLHALTMFSSLRSVTRSRVLKVSSPLLLPFLSSHPVLSFPLALTRCSPSSRTLPPVNEDLLLTGRRALSTAYYCRRQPAPQPLHP